MTRAAAPTLPRRIAAPEGLPRLLAGIGAGQASGGLTGHLQRWGPPPLGRGAAGLLSEIEDSGLRGRGGAWFPVARKWRAVGEGRLRRPVVVANGAEGEPVSAKDRLLLAQAPHLVLDGLALAATCLHATRAVVHVPRPLVRGVCAALDERWSRAIDPVEVEVIAAADRFVAGEESAVVARIEGGPGGVPTFTRAKPVYVRGVEGRPTLVQNVETLAHVALIGRFGAPWFRDMGTEDSPGTALLSVSGPWNAPRVVEASLGTPLAAVLASLGLDAGSFPAVLLGGYGGTWLSTEEAAPLPLCEEAARQAGATLGAGVVALLGRSSCPLAETARLVRYMQGESAGQCGPCVNGLGALADATEALAHRPVLLGRSPDAVVELCSLVEGRGACHHPDGVARMVRSALRVFSRDVLSHLASGRCSREAVGTR